MSNIEDIKFQEMDERIELFLRGEMSMEEEAHFREELKTNSELREHAHALTMLLKAIRAKEWYHDRIIIHEVEPKQICACIGPEDEEDSPTATKRPYYLRRFIIWASSIAAALILYFGYSYNAENVRYAQVNEMLTPYYELYDIDALSRGETDSVAIAHLYSLFNRIPEETDMTDIIAELEPIYDSLESDYTYYPYSNDVSWNLALSYVKAGEDEKAIVILNELCASNPASPIEGKAEKLLKTLKSR